MQDQLSNRQEAEFGFPELGIGVRGDVTWHGSVYFHGKLPGFVI